MDSSGEFRRENADSCLSTATLDCFAYARNDGVALFEC
jgi:hypothetical protein